MWKELIKNKLLNVFGINLTEDGSAMDPEDKMVMTEDGPQIRPL